MSDQMLTTVSCPLTPEQYIRLELVKRDWDKIKNMWNWGSITQFVLTGVWE